MRKTNISTWLCFVTLLLGVSLRVQAQSWSVTGSMAAQRAFFSATVLNNGEVLVAGGRNRQLYGLGTAELFNPATGTFSATGNLNNRRAEHTATLLNNGKVLIAGGDFTIFMSTGTQRFCLSSAELYDPSTGKFTLTGSMHAQRCGGLFAEFTATLLQNGMVLVAGGRDLNGIVTTVELYDPASGTFSVTSSPNTPRFGHTATLLPNGEVLIAGGFSSNYWPAQNCITPQPALSRLREV